MAVTLAQLKERIAERMGDPTGERTLKLAADALREAVNELNIQSWWMNFEPDELITLVTSTKEYSLASPVVSIDSAWYLNVAANDVESPVTVLPFATFVRAGFLTSVETGRPVAMTFNEETGKVRLDRSPTAAENGRKVSIAYYKGVASQPASVDDILGGLLVEMATWRVRRYVPGYDWVADLKIADREKLRVRSMARTFSRFAVGRK